MQEDLSSLRNAYSQAAIKALVLPFMERMELALGAATMAIARSGASFISEMAAAGCPSLLIPYPHSADEHQRVNARTLADANAALMDEKEMTPQRLIAAIERLSAISLSGKDPRKSQTFDAGYSANHSKWFITSTVADFWDRMLQRPPCPHPQVPPASSMLSLRVR